MLGNNRRHHARTRTRQLTAGAGWRLVGALVVLTVAGIMILEVGLSKAGRWAEVLGSGLTNLLRPLFFVPGSTERNDMSMRADAFVVQLQGRLDPSSVGAKAGNLARVMEMGLSVHRALSSHARP